MPSVRVEHHTATAGELHALDPFAVGTPASPSVWVCEVTSPAFVVGSRQSTDLVDGDACSAAGIDVERRRSGGGAVLLRPGAQVWIDLVIPQHVVRDGNVPDDVRGSMVWVGEVWRDALVRLGADRDQLDVHTGAMVRTPWSDLVCFAGVGPGEIVVGERKLLGLSQRRTRHGLRVQSQMYRERGIAAMTPLFARGVELPGSELAEPVVVADVLPARAIEPDDAAIAAAVASAAARQMTRV